MRQPSKWEKRAKFANMHKVSEAEIGVDLRHCQLSLGVLLEIPQLETKMRRNWKYMASVVCFAMIAATGAARRRSSQNLLRT